MIKSVTVTNYLGESLKMELTNPYDSGIAITDITGIGPGKADINVTELTSSDGSLYNSARLGTRNIVMTLRFMIAPDIETVRQKSYKYFPIKKELILTFETDNRSCYIAGYVESNEPVIFDENEYTQISIMCPDPYFYSTEANAMVFSGVVPMFEFEFSNETENGSNEERNIIMSEIEVAQEQTVYYNGDSEIGVTIQIHAIGTVENVTIYNTVKGVRSTAWCLITASILSLGVIVSMDSSSHNCFVLHNILGLLCVSCLYYTIVSIRSIVL